MEYLQNSSEYPSFHKILLRDCLVIYILSYIVIFRYDTWRNNMTNEKKDRKTGRQEQKLDVTLAGPGHMRQKQAG